jgi:hypothetical protein
MEGKKGAQLARLKAAVRVFNLLHVLGNKNLLQDLGV